MEQAAPDAQMGRLLWRCRRGMKELDLLLTGYLRQQWAQGGPAEKAAFERILELPDPLLAAYLMQRETPADPDLASLLATLRRQMAGGLPVPGPAAAAPRPPGP
jgi:antitoxin CptB